MQRRLNIAAALLHKPAVILMDEPTVGLDPQNRANILELVEQIALGGAAILYSTHYMDEVERICSRIGIIDHGKLLVEGSLAELRTAAGGKEILTLRGRFDTGATAQAFSLRPGEALLKSSAEEIVLNLTGAEGRLTSLLAEASRVGEVREVAMNRQSLESLFIQLTGRELRE
jgi:ABC-2 type transport system ATP-binding protein